MAVKIGLVGTGTVGGGCIDIIQKHKDDFLRHFGVDIELARVCSLSTGRASRRPTASADLFTAGLTATSSTIPEIDIVVELIGGTTVARNGRAGRARRRQERGHRQQGAHGHPRARRCMDSRRAAAGKELAFEADRRRRHPHHRSAEALAHRQRDRLPSWAS